MILRPLQPAPRSSDEYQSAWPVVDRIERQKYESCWLITQPSHAALAAELTARLSAPQFPKPDAQLIQAIALHDAGWGVADAQGVQKSRSGAKYQQESFLDVPAQKLATIWQDSIGTAESASAAGGYVVSRHFDRIAGRRIAAANDHPPDRRCLEAFVNAEASRQKKLAAKQPLPVEELERLVDLLQFVDLLSLYLCCGATDNAVFPECLGVQVQVSNEAENFRFKPQIFQQGGRFTVAALRHPAGEGVSGREMAFEIG